MVILLKLVYVLASTPPPLFNDTAEDDGLVLPSGISLSGGGEGDDCTIVLVLCPPLLQALSLVCS